MTLSKIGTGVASEEAALLHKRCDMHPVEILQISCTIPDKQPRRNQQNHHYLSHLWEAQLLNKNAPCEGTASTMHTIVEEREALPLSEFSQLIKIEAIFEGIQIAVKLIDDSHG
mmetsp:Transcript_57743/g.172339  ORF Transcript_57743/g.172339 Transcript_57743/m.172339 type:complete len:114 (+) Transcript_57743:683-1024(+)